MLYAKHLNFQNAEINVNINSKSVKSSTKEHNMHYMQLSICFAAIIMFELLLHCQFTFET